MSENKVWLITGSNTGFGEAIAREALSRGDRVVATARRPQAITLAGGLGRVLPLPLDVTDPASVESAVATTMEHFGRIDVLVSNAGHGLIGASRYVGGAGR